MRDLLPFMLPFRIFGKRGHGAIYCTNGISIDKIGTELGFNIAVVKRYAALRSILNAPQGVNVS